MPTTINIAFTGGGTGGHIFPILAVAEELEIIASKLGVLLRMWYIGPTKGPIDIDLALFRSAGIEVCAVGGKNNIFSIIIGLFQSIWHLYFIMPDIIFSKGGYGAFPPLVAAVFYRIPFFIHESDTVPGKTSLWSAKFAKRIAVAFHSSLKFFPESQRNKFAVVGNPLRPLLLEKIPQQEARERLELISNRKTIFFVGGSQGANILNEAVLDILPELIREYQIIHQCGARNFGETEREAKFTLDDAAPEIANGYKLYGFLSAAELRDVYAASDLIVSRAGSGSIFEIAAQAKPAILVPLRSSAQDHQRVNAYTYAETGAAIVLEEENLSPHILVSQIKTIIENDETLRVMSAAAENFAKPDATRKIAEELLRSVGVKI